MKQSRFLAADWRKLILANYEIRPSLLADYLPPKTELDYFQGRCYVSLVGFMFENVRVQGFKIPFHINFPEVNLRFYVRYKDQEEWRRGVVFISEIVPRPAISLLANRLFYEHYRTMKMRNSYVKNGEEQLLSYGWKYKNNWNSIACRSDQPGLVFGTGTEEDFITQHFWGYTALAGDRLAEYHVEHPPWVIYPVKDHKIDCDFAGLYGKSFSKLSGQEPVSVIFAEGSPITVFKKRILY